MRGRVLPGGFSRVSPLLLAAALCSAAPAPAAGAPLNVVLVVWDTARYDHTAAAGYSRGTTPNLSALAAGGLFFTNAFSQSDWTTPALASLLTGLRPSSHGIIGAGDRLAAPVPTLAEQFKARGFSTAAFTVGVIPGVSGLERGFDTARNLQSAEPATSSVAGPQAAALDWLEAHSREPFFLFIHGSDAHYPYVCPPASRLLYTDKAYRGPARELKVGYGFVSVYDRYLEPDFLRTVSPSDWDRAQTVRSSPADLAELTAQYDGCLGYADSLLPRLTSALAREGLDGNTVLIVLSDHGESLGGHGGYGHMARPLYEEVYRIVLAARLPGAAPGRRISAPVELIDLMPTLLQLEGWPVPAGAEGRGLAALLRGGEAPPEPLLWASASSRPSAWPKRLDLQALRYGRWKALRVPEGWKLYDVVSDPREKKDLLASRPEVFLDLAARLLSLPSAAAVPAGPPAPGGENPGGERALLRAAEEYERKGDLRSLERTCLDGLAAYPREEGLAYLLARVYAREGRWEELAALRRKYLGGEETAPAPRVIDLAGALALARRYGEAGDLLRRAAAGPRPAAEKALLGEKAALVDRLELAPVPAPPVPEKASVARNADGWTVASPPWLLKYSAAAGKFSLERDGRPAGGGALRLEAALAQSLLDRVEEGRFSAEPAAAEIPPELAEKLKAAGYLGE